MVLQVRPTLTVDNTLLCDVHGGMAVYVLVLAAAFTLDGLSRYYKAWRCLFSLTKTAVSTFLRHRQLGPLIT